MHDFVARAQKTGEFRDDLPTDWLVASFHAILHAAANEIAAGRIEADRAAGVITATMLGAYGATPRQTLGHDVYSSRDVQREKVT